MGEILGNFVSWETLATMGGCMAMVAALTQLAKSIDLLAKASPRLVSYALAVVILMLAGHFTGGLTAGSAALTLFNAAAISLAANGGYDAAMAAVRGRGE